MGKNSDVLTRIIKKDEAKKSTSSATPGAGSAAAYGGGGNKGSPALPEKESIRSYTEALIARRNTARQRTEAESTNPYIRALAEQSGKITGKIAGSAANIYHQALSGAGTPTGATWEDANALTRRTSAAPAGNTWEDTNALARETAPAQTYAELLKRNYAAQFSGQGVTPQMQAELENAGRAESDYRARKRRAEMTEIGRRIAEQSGTYEPVQTPTPERKELSGGVTEQMTTAEVKAALPGLQEAADYARDRYQKIWDRNIRIGTDQGQVPPEMIAELWEAERDKNETEQRLNLALARNEELSYGDMLGNTKTDLSRVGELQERLEKVTGAGGSTRGMSVDQIRTEQQEVVGALNGIRASLRAEGYSDEEITALFGYLRRERNAENAKAMQEEARAAAAERGSLGNLAINTGTGLLGGAGYIDLAMQNLFAGQDAVTGQRARVDYNSAAQSMYQIGEATMQGEMDKLLEKYSVTDENGNRSLSTEGQIRAGAYQLAGSMGQSAVVAGLTAMGVPCAMLLLSGSAATQTTHQMHEAGYSDGTALLMGGIAGAAEYVTEKIGMDELFKTRDFSTAKGLVRGILRNMHHQAMSEGSEEVLSTVINTLADLIVNGDKNELEQRYRECLAQGMTEDQAQKKAAGEWLGGVWQDFYMGYLSGLFFGAGGTAFQGARNAVTDTRTGRAILDAGTVNELQQKIGALDSRIAEAANVPTADGNSSARQLGAAQRGLERAQAMENIRGELEARGEENITPALLSGLYAATSQQQEQRLTREEKRAMRGSEAAQELAEEWAKQWKDGSVPAPYAGAEDVLRERLFGKKSTQGNAGKETAGRTSPSPAGAGQTGAANAQEGTGKTQAGAILSSMGEQGKRMLERYTKGLTGAAYDEAVNRLALAYQKGRQGEVVSYQTAEERAAHKAGRFDRYRVENARYNKDAGLKKNDTYEKMRASKTLTSRVARQINALGKVLGVQVELVDDLGGEGVSGYYEDGVIRIAVQPNADPLTITAIHEAVHRIRETDPETYNMLAETVQQLMQENPEAFTELFANQADMYGQTGENGEIKAGGIDYTQEEVTAKALGVVLSKSDMLEKLAARNRTGVQKLLDMVTDILERVRQFTNGDYQLSREDAEGFRDLEKHMKTLQAAMERALESARANTQVRTENEEQGEGSSEGKASIKRSSNIPYKTQVGFFFGRNNSLSRTDDLAISATTQSDPKFGLSGKPFFMLKRNVAKSIRTKGNNENYSAHGIGEDVINRVPEHISSPALVIVGNGRVSILGHEYVTTLRNEHAPLLIGIDPNSSVDGKPANEVKSIYGLDDLIGWLKARGADSTIYAGDMEKATALLRDAGLQLSGPVAYADDLTQQILALIDERSNNKNENGEQIRKYSFAGKKAKTADSTTLAQAEKMETEGRSNEEIRQETGWYRGMDGQWRFEIDDSGATYHRGGDAQFRKDHPEYARYLELTDKMLDGSITDEEFAELRELAPTWGAEQRRLQDMVNRGDIRLNMILDHPALFEAYPELRSARVVFQDMEEGEKGSYDPKTNTITLSNEVRSAAEDTLIHEVEHAIQAAEGFSGGASVEYWMNQGYSEEEAKRLYRNTAGEVEARDAANRRNLTAEERKNTPPDLGDENTVFAEDDKSFSVDLSGRKNKAPHGLVLDAIRSHFQEISSDQAVKDITGNEFQKTESDTRSLRAKIKEFFDSIGNKVSREGFGDIALNSAGVHDSLEHGYGRLKAATFAALPDVLQKGKIINADPNHTLHPYDSYLIMAPVNVGTGENAERCYVGAIVIRDANTQRYKIHEVLTERENGTSSDKSEAHQLGSELRYDVPSTGSIPDSSEKSNPENDGKPTGKQSRKNTADEEQRQTNRAVADGMADGRFGGVDIMPEEGEEAASSVIGLTDEDNADLDRRNNLYAPPEGFPASDLFGDTNEVKEQKATDTAAKEGNAALAAFAEEMPDDPMDLYQQQDKVNTQSGGDDGNSPKKQPGYEKMNSGKEQEKKTLRQKIADAWHSFLRGMVNEADAIHQAGRKTGNKALDGMYFYAKAAAQRAQQWIQGQRMSFDLSKSGKGLNAIFDPIRAKGEEFYRNFQLYMYHMLNVERMSRDTAGTLEAAQQRVNELAAVDPSIATMSRDELRRRAQAYAEGNYDGYGDDNGELVSQYWEALQERDRAEKQQNKPVFGWDEGYDADESRKIADDLLAAHPEFEQLAQEVYDYVDALLQYRVDAGLITAEDMNRLKETYPHYIPVMYKTVQEDTARQKKGNVQTDDAIKSARGGEGELEPLHLALARQTLSVMKNSGYQQLGAEVLKEYENNKGIMGQYVKDVQESEAAWDESLADNDDVNVPYENVISVFRDGKRFDITLSDDMSFAFQSLNGKQSWNDWQLAMKGNNLFKKLCTAYNPLFMITNPIRDVQDALFYSTDTKRWLANYPRAVAQIAGNGKYWQMYKAMGAVNNSYFDWATGENTGKMGKVEALNMAIEQMPRLAEFMTVLQNAERKNGKVTQADMMEAFNAAAEITTNFSRGGTMGKWINRNLVPFWNPGVQGLSKAVRTVSETKGFKAWAGLAIKAAALGMVPALLNGLLYRDDDEWDKIDDQMKMEYYLFKTSDGVWIKVPKGRVLAALSMPVVGVQETLRGDEVDWGELAKQAFGSVAPNNPLETNLLSTAMQAKLFDKDDPGKTWYGGDIESRRLQGYAPGERYDESTDRISKWLGGKLDLSPKKISYIIDQYSGILGDVVLPYLTPKAERGLYAGNVAVPLSNAFMSRFTLDTVTSNTISSEYYGLLDELGFAAKGGDDPAAIAERYMNRAGSTVSDLYAQIREIENDKNLTDREKTTLTRELRKQLNEYEAQVTADAQKYLESARAYMDEHPEFDYTDDDSVEAFMEGYNSVQTNEKYEIDAEQAAAKMKEEVYREVNREHFGAEYALQVYNKDVYAKAQRVHDESGLSYDDYYDYYFGTRYLYGDKDAEGNTIAGTKTDKVVSFLEGMKITDEQRNALYHAEDHTWNYPAGISKYLKEHPEYDFTDEKAVGAFTEGYNSMQSSEKYHIDAAEAKSKMRSEVYREIYRSEYGAEYALKFFDKEVYEKAAGLNKDSGLSYDDYYEYYFGTRYMFADKDKNGKSISGSKKEKVVGFIDKMDITNEQKDALYLAAGYTENSLKTTPWNGGSGKYGSSGGGGGRRRRSGGGSKAVKVKSLPGAAAAGRTGTRKSTGTGAGGEKVGGIQSDASDRLLEIIDKYYDGNMLAAAFDGGRKARSRIDFEL